MVGTYDWLPMGSVVKAVKGEHQIMVAGVMVTDGNTGRMWDYLGYLFPEGRGNEGDLFFDKEDIEEIYQVGFLNATGCAFQAYLEERTPEFEEVKARSKEGTEA